MDNQHKSLKLKKVIKRMEDLEDNTISAKFYLFRGSFNYLCNITQLT